MATGQAGESGAKMKRKMVIYRDGIRYWCSKKKLPDGRLKFNFWSSHEWPFHHGSYITDKMDGKDLWARFRAWIPDDSVG